MYSVTVRDHIMIAHSLKGKVFGPAQNLHGATYVVDVKFKREELDENNIVIDIGLASRILHEVASEFNYRNLDELERFQSQITTTEFLAKTIHDEISKRLAESPGEDTGSSFKGTLKVTLNESHVASAAYEGPMG